MIARLLFRAESKKWDAVPIWDTSLNIFIYSVSSRGQGTLVKAVEPYLQRTSRYIEVEARDFATEWSLLEAAGRQQGRVPAKVVLLDSLGRQFSSEDFAEWVGAERDGGRQRLILAVGPADGWSDVAKARADMLLSLGPMTLPHELARLVLVEQVYRAFTILEGHPYHSGH